MRRRDVLAAGAAGLATGLSGGRGAAGLPPGFVVPPEDARHRRTFLQWPVSRRVHPDPVFLEMVQDTIARIANTIVAFESVTVLAAADAHGRARRRLAGAVTLWDIPTEDLWCRDSGPLFAQGPDGALAVSHIRFNGWGGKQIHARDGRIAALVAERLGLPVFEAGLTGEPGGVDHDGHGLMIAHESSWVIGNRNPGLSRTEIEARLLAAYGAERMIWAPGLAGEDITDYHIDSLARFTGPGRVLMNLPPRPDPGDPFHAAAARTHARLIAGGLEVDVIPEPELPRIRHPEFVASYVNFHVCNGAVIAAQFGDPDTDAEAARALARHFPGRELVMLEADALGEIGGGIHCATMQMPA